MLTTRQVEAWSGAMKQVRLDEPSLPATEHMTMQQWTFLSARAVIKAGLVEHIDPNTDIDEVPVWEVEEIGELWQVEYNKAMTIEKKNGSKKSPIIFSKVVPLPAI